MSLNISEIRDLLVAINQTDIAELTLKSDDFELTVRRGVRADGRLYTVNPNQVEGSGMDGSDFTAPSTSTGTPGSAAVIMPDQGFVAGSAHSPTPSAPPPQADRRLVEIISPMVGTFYRSPAPDEPPFVEVGNRVRVGQAVCIIEAMKLMNELESEVSGEIVEILVQNGEPVEYGQPLMRVNPGN